MPYKSKVSDIIKSSKKHNPLSVNRDENAKNVTEQMRIHKVGVIGVTDASGFLLGVISHDDLLYKIIIKHSSRKGTLARDIMTPRKKLRLLFVTPNTLVERYLELMKENDVEYLVVETPTNNKFLGLISLVDALRMTIKDCNDFKDDLQNSHDNIQSFVATS